MSISIIIRTQLYYISLYIHMYSLQLASSDFSRKPLLFDVVLYMRPARIIKILTLFFLLLPLNLAYRSVLGKSIHIMNDISGMLAGDCPSWTSTAHSGSPSAALQQLHSYWKEDEN